LWEGIYIVFAVAMPLSHDLDDYKLETTFQKDPEYVLHTSYKADRGKGIRKAAVVEKWARQKYLGGGSFGSVHLEMLMECSHTTHRAVKQLYKADMARMKIDVKKELIALKKFSRAKVRSVRA
jgi:hypothetical protein